MSYSIDIERDHFLCRSQGHANTAAELISRDAWMARHLRVSPALSGLPSGSPQWKLVVEEFDGCAWDMRRASHVWIALREHLADRSFVEIRTEHGERFRYRWENGQLHHDEAVLTIWREYSLLGPFQQLEPPEVLPAVARPVRPAPRTPVAKGGARARSKKRR